MESLPGRFRELFPITERYVYLNHASVGPLSRPTRDCMARVVDGATFHGPRLADEMDEMLVTARCRAARLVNAQPHQIGFLRNTSEGISVIANGIDWRRGDNIVTAAVEFPSNVYPWRRIADCCGVELRAAQNHDGSMVDVDELLALIDERTRVVALSWVQFATGQRLDIRHIGKACRERDVLFVVDAIQGLGVLHLDVEKDYVDAFAAGAHKFLLGPKGVSLFYVSDRALRHVRPTVIGWTAVRDYSDYMAHEFEFREGAARFEGGTVNVAGICGLGEAIDLMLQASPASIEAHLLSLGSFLVSELEARGYQIAGSRIPSEMSAIVTCRHAHYLAADICRHLDSRNIVTSARHEGLRIAPHFYNSRADLEFLLEELPQ
jgi:cysteine desulfurase / selenocysteine lyase